MRYCLLFKKLRLQKKRRVCVFPLARLDNTINISMVSIGPSFPAFYVFSLLCKLKTLECIENVDHDLQLEVRSLKSFRFTLVSSISVTEGKTFSVWRSVCRDIFLLLYLPNASIPVLLAVL